MAVGIVLLPILVSYGIALTKPGGDSLAIRSVEWVRDNGGAGLVNWAEHTWYSWNPPPTGGVPKGGFVEAPPPSIPPGTAAPGRPSAESPVSTAAPVSPAAMRSPAQPQLPGEGVWRPLGRVVGGRPVMWTASLRPDAVHTSLVAGFVRIEQQHVAFGYVAGLEEPGGGPGPERAMIPPAWHPKLVATFNSGFKTADAHGGAILPGPRVVGTMTPGDATFAISADGRAKVGVWGVDIDPTRDRVVAARQNLAPIVVGGRPGPGLNSNDQALWGHTLGNTVLVWRSGVGETADGSIVYVAGPGLSVESLADLLIRAGAVRGMQLDINTDWMSFMSYTGGGPGEGPFVPVKLMPDMKKPADRYLHPGNRDFFTVVVR